MAPQRSFPTLPEQGFAVPGNGRFGVIDPGVGPRICGAHGTIDCWFKMGSGADTVVLAQSGYSSTTAPLITMGVNGSGQATGSIQDVAGTTVAAWTAASMAANAQGVLVHMQVAWSATATINGVHHVKVHLNDVFMPVTDFTTAPVANWSPFQPLYLTTGTVTETGFDGEMILTQVSLKVVI